MHYSQTVDKLKTRRKPWRQPEKKWLNMYKGLRLWEMGYSSSETVEPGSSRITYSMSQRGEILSIMTCNQEPVRAAADRLTDPPVPVGVGEMGKRLGGATRQICLSKDRRPRGPWRNGRWTERIDWWTWISPEWETATWHFAVSPKRPAEMGSADQRTLAHGINGGRGHLPESGR